MIKHIKILGRCWKLKRVYFSMNLFPFFLKKIQNENEVRWIRYAIII